MLRKLANIQKKEEEYFIYSCLFFFALLFAYYILKPIREEMGLSGGVSNYKWLYTATFACMFIVNPVFSFLVSKWERHKFISIVYRFVIVNLLIFIALLHPSSPLSIENTVNIGRVYFVWLSVFNLVLVSVFWGFMVDLFSNEQAKRLFGAISIGGTLGAIAGSSLTAGMAERFGAVNLMFISVLLIEASVQCMNRLNKLSQNKTSKRPEGTEVISGNAWSGITQVIKSPYLIGICIFLLLQTLCSTFAYYQQGKIIQANVADSNERTAIFATIYLWGNVIVLFIQLFLTGRIISFLGIGLTLTLLPLVNMVGFSGLGICPTLSYLIIFQVMIQASKYALSKPSREILFTVVSREQKYKSKVFIDTFVYRTGDNLWMWAVSGLSALGLGISTLSFMVAPIAGVWMLVGLLLGRQQKKLAIQTSKLA